MGSNSAWSVIWKFVICHNFFLIFPNWISRKYFLISKIDRNIWTLWPLGRIVVLYSEWMLIFWLSILLIDGYSDNLMSWGMCVRKTDDKRYFQSMIDWVRKQNHEWSEIYTFQDFLGFCFIQVKKLLWAWRNFEDEGQLVVYLFSKISPFFYFHSFSNGSSKSAKIWLSRFRVKIILIFLKNKSFKSISLGELFFLIKPN